MVTCPAKRRSRVFDSVQAGVKKCPTPLSSGELKAACAATGHDWPGHQVLDTARLARHVVTRDEAPNCKLASLARLFRAGTTPDHRALSDALLQLLAQFQHRRRQRNVELEIACHLDSVRARKPKATATVCTNSMSRPSPKLNQSRRA